jgi:hypothetical protein
MSRWKPYSLRKRPPTYRDIPRVRSMLLGAPLVGNWVLGLTFVASFLLLYSFGANRFLLFIAPLGLSFVAQRLYRRWLVRRHFGRHPHNNG